MIIQQSFQIRAAGKFALCTSFYMFGCYSHASYLQKNPQHTIPTLEDDGYILWDSHAINIYLVDKYAKDDSLYPKDLQKRGKVNQRLFFNSSVLSNAMGAVLVSIVFIPARLLLVITIIKK